MTLYFLLFFRLLDLLRYKRNSERHVFSRKTLSRFSSYFLITYPPLFEDFYQILKNHLFYKLNVPQMCQLHLSKAGVGEGEVPIPPFPEKLPEIKLFLHL